jgi:hypothetical protein
MLTILIKDVDRAGQVSHLLPIQRGFNIGPILDDVLARCLVFVLVEL